MSPNDTTMLDILSAIHSTPAYAQQKKEQPVLPDTTNQYWIDKESNTKVSFTYSPETPPVGRFTDLKFKIEDLKSGTYYKDVSARVIIIDGRQQQQQVPLIVYNITAPKGHFSIKYQFTHEGTYQIIVKVNSNYSALTLASFKMVVPFQPLGVININYIFPLLVPAILVTIVGAVAILSFMVIVANKNKK